MNAPWLNGNWGVGFRLAATCLSCWFSASAHPIFELVDLGTLGGDSSQATAINRAGHVVGEAETKTGELHAYIWSPDAGMRDLGTLGGSTSRALAISDAGMVVGESITTNGDTRAFYWTEATGMRPLASSARTVFSTALGLNEAGRIVGTLENEKGAQAVVWYQGAMFFLNRLPGSGNIQPLDINRDGDVVGQIQTGAENEFSSLAFFFPRATDARTLSDFRLLSPYSGCAVAINDQGDVAGFAMQDSSRMRAFRFSRRQPKELLDTDDVFFSSAAAINEAGVIAGSYIATYGADESACYWNGERRVDLNLVTDKPNGWWLIQASGINDAGLVVGHGLYYTDNRAFLLRPLGTKTEKE